jgi:hypothetical protein
VVAESADQFNAWLQVRVSAKSLSVEDIAPERSHADTRSVQARDVESVLTLLL